MPANHLAGSVDRGCSNVLPLLDSDLDQLTFAMPIGLWVDKIGIHKTS